MSKKSLKRTNKLKAFISYSIVDRKFAAKLGKVLDEYGIDCFLAHESLTVSEEWPDRLLEELKSCDLFIPILSKKFRKSDWTAQEIGVAVSRPEVRVIPLALDSTLPFGFIAKIQCKKVSRRSPDLTEILLSLIGKYPRSLIPAFIERVHNASSFRRAESVVSDLIPYFKIFSNNEVDSFVDAALANRQVWDANLCVSEYLPNFIKKNRKRISRKKLKALTYQMNERKPYRNK